MPSGPRQHTRTGFSGWSCRPACPRRHGRFRSIAPSRGRSHGEGGLTMADVETPELEVVEIPDIEEAVRREEPLPEALPILPLRETVTYPDTLTPLAVAQEQIGRAS